VTVQRAKKVLNEFVISHETSQKLLYQDINESAAVCQKVCISEGLTRDLTAQSFVFSRSEKDRNTNRRWPSSELFPEYQM
jgi:hypothetical protein